MKIQKGMSLLPQDPAAAMAEKKEQLREAAQMYEQHFLDHMVKQMRATVDREGGMMKPSFAENIFSEQLDGKYVEGWTKKGGIGLADMIYDQISKRLDAVKGPMPGTRGVMPIAPEKGPIGIPAGDSIKMKQLSPPDARTGALEYRFELNDPTGTPHEAQAPMAGKVVKAEPLADGWQAVKLDHGQGMTSELTFPGRATEMSVGEELAPGQKLGMLDPKRPVLAWKLEWS